MNSKKKDFLISLSIIFVFVLVIILYLNYYFISVFGLNQDNFIFLIIPLLIFGLSLFLFFSNSLLKPLFKSDEKLQQSIKETIHELNIPVSTIQMNTQMLERKITDEKLLKRLNRIKTASDDLLKLYENMEYDIKKEIDSLDSTEFNLDNAISNTLNKFEDIKKDIPIKFTNTNLVLNCDINGFEKVLDNLLSNAIKYNDKKQPLIKIYKDNNNLCIFNNGETIDTKNLFVVFDKYYQEDSSKDGFGLGLSIVKEFCDKNKISIKINTSEKGNLFLLNLKEIIKKV